MPRTVTVTQIPRGWWLFAVAAGAMAGVIIWSVIAPSVWGVLPERINQNIPAGTESIGESDDRMRELRSFLVYVFGLPESPTMINASVIALNSQGRINWINWDRGEILNVRRLSSSLLISIAGPGLSVAALDSTAAIRVLTSLTVLGSLSVDRLLSLSAEGIRFSDGSTQTTTPGISQTVLTLTSSCAGSCVPSANTLYSANIVKAWARSSAGTSPTYLGSFGMGVLSRCCPGNYLFSLARPMRSTSYVLLVTLTDTDARQDSCASTRTAGTQHFFVSVYICSTADGAVTPTPADAGLSVTVIGEQ